MILPNKIIAIALVWVCASSIAPCETKNDISKQLANYECKGMVKIPHTSTQQEMVFNFGEPTKYGIEGKYKLTTDYGDGSDFYDCRQDKKTLYCVYDAGRASGYLIFGFNSDLSKAKGKFTSMFENGLEMKFSAKCKKIKPE